MNCCIFAGRLARDPELRRVGAKNTACTSFTIAVDRGRKDQDGNKVTDFFNCFCWGTNAETLANYTHKGDMICVQGSAQNRKYTDKSNIERQTTEINVAKFTFCGSPSRRGGQQSEAKQANTSSAAINTFDPVFDDLDGPLPWD